MFLCDRLGRHLFVNRIGVGMQKADGKASDARFHQQFYLPKHGFNIERYFYQTIWRQTLTRLSAKWARH